MLIGSYFKTYDSYFHDILLFLQNVSWLFDFPVTEILTRDIFTKIPQEWKVPLLSLTNDELNLFPSGYVKVDWPQSLIKFQEQCQRFTLQALTDSPEDISCMPRKDACKEVWRGMTPKKKIEVELLSSLVHKECQSLGITNILDVGSGHGYVDRLLLNYGYKILGIETNLKMIKHTITQLEKTFPKSLSANFKYVQLNIDSSTFQSVKEIVRKYLIPADESNKVDQQQCDSRVADTHLQNVGNVSSENVSMIGLHACGDLAVNSMKLFLNLSEIKSLIMVPCCYHKMLPVDELTSAEVAYCNFPLSKTLKDSIESSNSNLVLEGPFLRLAGQATNSLWKNCSKEEHENHAFHVLSRAVVQLYCVQEGKKMEKSYRRVVKKSELDKNNFSAYVNDTLQRCTFSSTNILSSKHEDEEVHRKLLSLWDQHKGKLKMVEVITGLQMRIESVAESLIAADRICFLFENGIKDVRLVKLFDSSISPRGLVYLASK